ncbi:MAG: PAS domain S-box protein [Acidobacteria bacterium]|nr:PAS domain S-box protein [Acidobacteriota bacterium]
MPVTESALEMEAALFRNLADAAFDGIAIARNGRIESANPSFAGMFGYPSEQLLVGVPIEQLLTRLREPADKRGAIRKGVGKRRNCACFPIAVCHAPGADGEAVYGVRDISRETEAEARIVESERRYRELSEATHDLICKHDLEGRILEVNPAACRALGYSREELLTMRFTDLLAPRGVSLFREYLTTIVREGVAEGMLTLCARDGERRHWQYQNTLEVVGVERPVVRGLARDVTERERAIRALHENEAYFRSIIENVSDIVTTIGPAGTIEYHSASVARALGWTAEEFTGRLFRDFIHPDDAPAALTLIEMHHVKPAGADTIDLRVLHRDGSWRWFSITITSRVVDDSVQSVIVNGHDITTSRLLHAQLEQANRVNSLGKLAATVAHEFNNVLMGMLPFAELMQRPNVTPAVVEKGTRYILNSIARGKRVALDILRFTRPAEPTLNPVDLGEWWAHLGSEMHARLSDAIAFDSEIPMGLTILADADQLSQVFSNIIINARDAMPHGGRLQVRARRPQPYERFPFGFVANPSDFAHIEIEDSGSGMSREVVEHVFDPLFTTKQNGGTGLGMAVAHNVVTSHGGSIFVVSKVGVGTTFHLFLPLARSMATVASLPETSNELRVRQALIVDDEPVVAEGIAEMFREDGRMTAVALSGAQCENLLEDLRPDVAVLDVRLPDADGFELGARLRTRFPELRIVFASGDADARRMVDDRRCAFLQKPFEVRELFDAIASLEEVAP